MTNTLSNEAVAAAAAKQRRRGALSCAECRRLKLRCDRQFPCHSCRKRGCAAICPDGALTTGKGNRFILANTEELHEKISELQERIAHLEEGLSSLWASTSSDPSSRHPLLTDELLAIKTPLGAEIVGHRSTGTVGGKGKGASGASSDQAIKVEDEEDDVTDALGTLTIQDQGTKFFGGSAGSQFLLGHVDDDDEEERKFAEDPLSASSSFSPHISHLAHSYPFTTLTCDWNAIREQLEAYLPPPSKAWQLCQNYFDHGAWLYQPMYRQYFIDHIFTPIYNPSSQASSYPQQQQQQQPPAPPTVSSHNLAFLFIMFALGSILDLSKPPYGPEAEQYHLLARATLAAEGPVNNTLVGVQTLILMCYYNQLSDKKRGPDLAWQLLGIAAKMATSIGLHRDPGGWNLDPIEAERRRLIFWELTTLDAFLAQGLGRPSTIITLHVDAQLPADPDQVLNPVTGKLEHSFCYLKYTYAQTLINTLNEAFGVKRPKYDTILALDRRIRDLELPAYLSVAGLADFGDTTNFAPPVESASIVMQQHTIFCIKEATLLYLHRPFLARALSEQPEDPFRSRYAASVLAAHRSGCCVIVGVRNAFKRLPALLPRVYFLWVHAFTASIVLAAIVIRSPASRLAPSSLLQLDVACQTFEAASEGCRPARALPFLLQIRQKAHRIYEEFRAGKQVTPPPPTNDATDVDSSEDVYLAMLGGKTRVVSATKKKSSQASAGNSSNPQSHPSPISSSDSPRPITQEHVHPTLVEYLKNYNRSVDHQFQQQHSGSGSSLNASPSSSNSFQQVEYSAYTYNNAGPTQPMPQMSLFSNSGGGSNDHNEFFQPMLDNSTNFLAFEPMDGGAGGLSDGLNADVLMGNGVGYGQIPSTGELDVTWQFMSDLGIAP